MMRSPKQIRDNISDLREELDAIVCVSEREERDLNDEESARVAEISDKQIPALNRQLKTAISVDRERQQRQSNRVNEEIAALQSESGTISSGTSANLQVGRFTGLKVPARAKVHAPLKAYQGPDAQRDAYIAGNVILAGVYGNQHASEFCRNHGLQVNATLTTGTNSSGGFLVPD